MPSPDPANIEVHSIDQMRKPISGLIETESFCRISDEICNRLTCILHCHGVHGSGKSELVRKLAESFPSENDSEVSSFIKWHIQCSDNGCDVIQELKELVEVLQREGFLTDRQLYGINHDLEGERGGVLIDTLCKSRAHVLIVIEDPDVNSKKLLADMCRSLHAKSREERLCQFHIYFTSRNKEQILSADQIRKIEIYETKLLTGFSKQNALSFLNEAIDCTTDDDSATKIYERFSGLPLGLKAARKFCEDSDINYRDYLELAEGSELELTENERKTIAEEFGPAAEGVFQAIVMPFMPDDSSIDCNDPLHWKMLLCLSFFHHDCMPRFLLERCCYMLCDEQAKNLDLKVRVNTGQLIKKLLNYGMCSKTPQNDILLHQVVLNAFRLHRQGLDIDSKCLHLKKSIEIFCSLVSKDLRKKGYARMSQLRPHLQNLLKHIGSVNDVLSDQNEVCLYNALLSHLYDVTATVMSGESPLLNKKCNEYFQQALNLLWDDADRFIRNESESDVEDVAKEIIDISKTKGQVLPADFVQSYASKLVYCFDEKLLDYVKSICSEENKENIGQIFQNHRPKEELIRLLQSCDVFLHDGDYRSIFYAERLAAIMHSWSRAILDAETSKLRNDTQSEWMSLLSRAVACQCKSSYNKPLLCEWITVGGLISIWLQQKKDRDYLKKASDLCKETLDAKLEKTPMYENGLVMEVSSSFLQVTLWRNLVRISTRRVNAITESGEVLQSDATCKQLQKLALANANTFANSPACLVYCGKYYAARKKFDESLTCFRQYFRMISSSDHKRSFKNYCWGLYNFARLLACHPSPPAEEQNDAVTKCKEVLRAHDVISESLFQRLSDVLQILQRQ